MSHADAMKAVHLRDLFRSDAERAERFTTVVGDLALDWSRHLVTERTLQLLAALAQRGKVAKSLRSMFKGERVNFTENRSALHTMLRAVGSTTAAGLTGATDATTATGSTTAARNRAGQTHEEIIASELERMAAFTSALRRGEMTGATGLPIKTLVHIGIGGSHLGPAMAYNALKAFRHRYIRCKFVSNVDRTDLADAVEDINLEQTVFVVVSKSFTTSETLANASAARKMVVNMLGEDAVRKHFVAVSASHDAVASLGITRENTFSMWDWVGGRYSLGSAVGLSLMAAIGEQNFRQMLDGMRVVDEHLTARLECGAASDSSLIDSSASAASIGTSSTETSISEASTRLLGNAPMMMGMLAVWYRNFWGCASKVVLPYSKRLSLFPSYLQQLEMESNGKSVSSDGAKVTYSTAPVVWGGAGTDGQHSFHQMLHQGTSIVPADFIVFANPDTAVGGASGVAAVSVGDAAVGGAADVDLDDRHDILVANCLAQAAALAFGVVDNGDGVADSETENSAYVLLAKHMALEGGKPSTLLVADQLTPSVLGQLVALYEHQVAVQGALWGINSFDQFGVEHGKRLAKSILTSLQSSSAHSGQSAHTAGSDYDTATLASLRLIQKHRQHHA